MLNFEELQEYYNNNFKGHTDEEFTLAYEALDVIFDKKINKSNMTKKDEITLTKALNKSVKEIKAALKLLENWSYYVEECEKSQGYRPIFVG